jgi:hypothetical protein
MDQISKNNPFSKKLHPGILLFGLAAVATYMPAELGRIVLATEPEKPTGKSPVDLEKLRKAEAKRIRKSQKKNNKISPDAPTTQNE